MHVYRPFVFCAGLALHNILASVVDHPLCAASPCTPSAADVVNALGNDEDHATSSLYLLQRGATLMKKHQIDAYANHGLKHNESMKIWNEASHSGSELAAWPASFFKKHGPLGLAAADHPPIVIQAPAGYRMTLAILTVVIVSAICFFFFTEQVPEKAAKEGNLPIAMPLSPDQFLKCKEHKLHDFLCPSEAIFIVSVDGHEPLSYKMLKEFINSENADVSRFGIMATDRLAVILGDGPQAAVAFWAFSAQCVYCPINHKATGAEISFTLNDLPAKAVVASPMYIDKVDGYPIIECHRDPAIAGLFMLSGTERPVTSDRDSIGRDSIALVIQTSGTTKKPKIVPLSHENLLICCKIIVEMINITESDRSLNFLPLFHIGGIANNVITPVLSHSSVICADHFTGEEAFSWVVQHRPTWYYGSPTTHMLMMRSQVSPDNKSLRCIRNATAALLPSTASEMAVFWQCEILPGYGMSECTPIASHQSGKFTNLATVGPAAAAEIMISDTNEILVKGPSVFKGYEQRDHMGGEDPNIAAFDGGWFHTGDCGEMRQVVSKGEHQYLAITGRSKEIIIRGGENIHPLEVEDAVQDPRILDKVAFSLPHEQLGEVVGLAVKTTAPPEELGELLRTIKKNSNLDKIKCPEVIVSVDELPKGLAGKAKRIGLDRVFGLQARNMENTDDPIAFTWSKENGKLIEIDVADEYKGDSDSNEVDSLGLAKREPLGGTEIPDHIKTIIMAMYAIAAFSVTAFHGQMFLQYPVNTPSIALTLIHMQCGNVIGGMRWTMQCFMGCASYLQCKEQFSGIRVFILTALYFAYRWPIAPGIESLAYLVSREPVGSYYVQIGKRWFLGVMIISYTSFAYMRHKPYKGFQVLFLGIITAVLNVCPVQNMVLYNILPGWLNFAFQTAFNCGLCVWVGCIFIYYLVGHFGHDAVARILAHPLCKDESFQRILVCSAPFFFFLLQLAMFWGPAQGIGMYLEYNGYTWKWDPVSVFMDQIVSLGTILLLSQAVRAPAKLLAPMGACSLGIYLGGDICFFLPHGVLDMAGGSFGIIVDKFPILPPLQSLIYRLSFFWPFMVLAVFFYSVFQIAAFGIPFHKAYLCVVTLMESAKKACFGWISGTST